MLSAIHLPFNELWFNIIFWVLISMYGISKVGKFMASIPDSPHYDKTFKCNKTDCFFGLLVSLIFYCIGLFEFQYMGLIILTVLEIIIILILYVYTFISKQEYLHKKNEKLNTIKKTRAGNFK